jgi:hypothetical protein
LVNCFEKLPNAEEFQHPKRIPQRTCQRFLQVLFPRAKWPAGTAGSALASSGKIFRA